MSKIVDERRLLAWNDFDRDGAWRLYTLCRGCAEVKFCRGKERDLVVCRDCFLAEAPVVPFFELGLWDYADAAGAKREHARGLAILEQRKRNAEETRLRRLEEARKRRQVERESRDREILRMVAESDSYERVAERFGLKPKTVKNLVSQSQECLANPHGYAGENAHLRPVMDEPLSPPTPGQADTKTRVILVKSEEAIAKRRRTFQQRAQRQQLQVQELRAKGIVPAEIADRLGLSDRTVSRHLRAIKKQTAVAA